MSEEYEIDPRIAGYVAEISKPGIPFISTSHSTLRRLYEAHGHQVIDELLATHWRTVNELKGAA